MSFSMSDYIDIRMALGDDDMVDQAECDQRKISSKQMERKNLESDHSE